MECILLVGERHTLPKTNSFSFLFLIDVSVAVRVVVRSAKQRFLHDAIG